MISDEIQALRRLGKTDAEIAAVVEGRSGLQISADDITSNYVAEDQRHPR